MKIKKNYFNEKGLKSLRLGFLEWEEITDQGLNEISQGLKEFVRLENVCIAFYKCEEFTDQGLADITQALKRAINIPRFLL